MQNLEEAYKKSQQEEMPDLWARIEENLPEKKKKKIISITRYLGVAAAALFLCVLIPGVIRIAGSKNSADASTEAAFNTAVNFDSADAMAQVTEGAKDAEVGETTSQDAASEELFTMDSVGGGMDEGKNAVYDSYSTEEEEVFDCVAAKDNEMADEETTTIGSAKPETIQQNLTVQEIVQYDEYKVLVLSAADGTSLRVQVPDDIIMSFVIGENYDFSLQKQAGGDWEYVVLNAE